MLALIAGSGFLPSEVAAHLAEPPLVCALEAHQPDAVQAELTFRIETLGTFLAELKARGITEICMAGGIGRPAIDPTAIDAATMPLVPIIMQALGSGDDGALRAVIGIFEQAGFAVRAAHDIAPHLLPDPGCATNAQPTDAHCADAERGAEIVAGMARADVGQACAIRARQAIAIEAAFGTDWMLASLKQRPDGKGGILFKAPKPGQDRRVDLPAIGVSTVEAVHAAGLDGIVIEAGGVMVLDMPSVLTTCDRLGLFLWVREAG